MEADQLQKPEKKKHPLDVSYRRVVILQIYFPFLLILIVVGALVGSIWVAGSGSASVWADASLVMLIIPAFVMGLILLIFLAAFVYGIWYLIGILPEPMRQVQDIVKRIADSTERFANLAAKPVIIPRALRAGIGAAIKGILSIFSKPQ
jgi:ABC-type dipeptide/oligopeptide/nickel transport system permease component